MNANPSPVARAASLSWRISLARRVVVAPTVWPVTYVSAKLAPALAITSAAWHTRRGYFVAEGR